MRRKLKKEGLHCYKALDATFACFAQKAATAVILLFILQFCSQNAFAQNKPVAGIVKNSNGEPLVAVTVSLKGTHNATQTNSEGKYSLEVPSGNGVLIFSYVGLPPREVNINNRSFIEVQFAEEIKGLNEVVVVGYGTAKKATLTGSVSAVKGSEIIKSPSTNVSNSLGGRLPGLVTVTPSSEPGYDGSIIRIRGIHTLGNNNPLVVVDGVSGS